MKKNSYSLLILVLFNSALMGQTYRSLFSSDTTQWNVYELVPDAGNTIRYFTFSDTIIGNEKYRIIYREDKYLLSQRLGQDVSKCGYIREDTLTGKSWFLKQFENKNIEVLLMDIGLKKGDSFPIITDYRYQWIDSVIVDSVYLENSRRVIELDKLYYNGTGSSKMRFIEGIGPTSGFFMAEHGEQFGRFALLCKYENGKHIFSTESDVNGNCFKSGWTNLKYNHEDDLVTVYPNPSSSRVTIQIDDVNLINAHFTIFRLDGQKIIESSISRSRNEINFTQNGLYIFKVFDGNKILVKKIIIGN